MNIKKILAIICAAVLITACAVIPIAFAGENGKSGKSDKTSSAATSKASDDGGKVDTSNATSFKFTDSEIAVTEGAYSGYKVKGTSLTLNESGTYLLSGSCKDGSVKVKKGTSGVNIVLDGIDLTSSDTAPLALNKSSEVTVTVADNSENTLTDSKLNNSDDNSENENAENAVIKCKDGSKVTITGGGTLNINANAKNGIKSGSSTDEEGEAYLTVKQATININASVNDGINAGQLLNLESGSISVNAGDDGIHCDYVMNVGAENTDGPSVNITDCYEGLEAAELNVYSGNIKIHSEDDCMNAANSDLKDYSFKLNIAGGTLYMDSESGDGIDSNGTLTISGGSTEVWTANNADNQPLDADGEISITGGTVFAAGGSAGMGMNLTSTQPCLIFGSTSSADGKPGGGQQGGNHGGKPNGTPPQMNGSQDGNMTPPDMNNSQNGDSNMTPPDKKDSQDGDSNMTPPDKKDSQDDGGNMTPPDGNAGMPQGGGNAIISSDSTVTIKDSDGNTLYTAKAVCNVNQVVYSSDKLTADSSYTLYSGDTSVGTATAATGNISRENGRGGPSGDDSFDPDNKPQKPDGNSGTTKSDDTESTTANSSKSDQTTASDKSDEATTKSSDNTKAAESTEITESTKADTQAKSTATNNNSSAKSDDKTSANGGNSDSDSPLTAVSAVLPWTVPAISASVGIVSIILFFRKKSK